MNITTRIDASTDDGVTWETVSVSTTATNDRPTLGHKANLGFRGTEVYEDLSYYWLFRCDKDYALTYVDGTLYLLLQEL
jgi:hypothetical protein